MVTCLVDVFRPQVGVATVCLLRRLGVQLDFPANQTCCGQPLYNSGRMAETREIAQHTIRVFEPADTVIVPSGSCAAMLKVEYPAMFRDDPLWRRRAEELAGRTYELCDFIVNVLGIVDVGARFRGKVTYHYSCHLRNLGLADEPVRLIKAVRDAQFVPLDGEQECCGFGGIFSVVCPQISGAIVDEKARAIIDSGADVVVATDYGCLMNIGGRLHRLGSAVRTMHIAELLAG